jgi:hypothetical protein
MLSTKACAERTDENCAPGSELTALIGFQDFAAILELVAGLLSTLVGLAG